MKITIITCDECERGNNDGVVVSSYRLTPVNMMGSSENEHNINWGECVDLCNDCLPKVARRHEGKLIIKI